MNSKPSSLLLHLAPGDPEPMREQIARQLRDRVVRGELEGGTVLPGHRQLARQHRVAPSTVEAAYRVLLEEGLLCSPETGEVAGEVAVAELSAERRRELVERLQLEELVAQELGRRELEMARDVQRRLLPPSELSGPGWEVAARCLPARVVAGDFYDVLRRGDGGVDLVVADVAGKGFAASLIMASVKAMLPFVTTEGGVAESLRELNRRLAAELGRGEFVALALARYRPAERVVELANAGAPDPYLVRAAQAPRPLSAPGPRLPLGVRADVAYASRTAEVADGESLLLLSDGLPEARDERGEPLGYAALESLLSELPAAGSQEAGFQEAGSQEAGLQEAGSPTAWLGGLFDRVQKRTGRLPEDDWTAAMLLPRTTEDTEEEP